MKWNAYVDLTGKKQQTLITRWRNEIGNVDEPKFIRFKVWLEKQKEPKCQSKS